MKHLLTLLLLIAITGCSKQVEPPITIGINPWPGYELLYLAEQKGFLNEVGANVRLVHLSSLTDSQRAYINGNIDGFASTLIEVVQAQVLSGRPLQIVMATDYSTGGDVIITHTDNTDMQALAGKRIGGEVTSLGVFVLQRALSRNGMMLSDINIVNVEQSESKNALLSGRVDAVVTYAPVSMSILEDPKYHVVFNSTDIPEEILDVVSISSDTLKREPELVTKLQRAWQMAFFYFLNHKQEAAAIMAKREGISPQEFITMVNDDMVILDINQQHRILSEQDRLQSRLTDVCETLVIIGSLQTQCDKFDAIIHPLSAQKY
jgi:NitT/TauT family transport system substrate-binding protein